MSKYNPNDREKIRRAYLQRGPHQPRGHKFRQTAFGKTKRRFIRGWFDLDLYKPWLEYNLTEDAAFCLYCYLCDDDVEASDGKSFITKGFNNWKKSERFKIHIGGPGSAHNQARQKCEDLMNQNQHITYSFIKQSDQIKIEYKTRLLASVDCVRYLLHQGLAFRSHDESELSSNHGNFRELLKFLADHNEETRKFILQKAPKNNKLYSHKIQIDIASSCAIETSKLITEDIGDDYFSMDSSSAFYVHCFAHQLQLVLVAVAKNHVDIALLFTMISKLVNVVGASCKRKDLLNEKQAEKILEAIDIGEIETGKGLNQEYTLQRATDTRWGSHYVTLLNISILFSYIIEVLEYVVEDCGSSEQKAEAIILLDWTQSFDFVFALILMKSIHGITNELSLALQRKDQDIVNAMELVGISKQRLKTMRNEGWESLVKEVYLFCEKYSIAIPKMDDVFVARGRPRRVAQQVTNLHHYENELFKNVIDWVLQELRSRFNETTTELLLCMVCLNPDDSFSSFKKEKLVILAQLYPSYFSETGILVLENQLDTYIFDMKSSVNFSGLKGVGYLAMKLVETKKNFIYHLVYRLIKLVLVLPISTASVERSFSAMKIVKTRLRNKIGDQWLNDCLVTYIEKEIFQTIPNDSILKRFQTMRSRRCQLPST